jgi:L,D-transpeptidase-like protein
MFEPRQSSRRQFVRAALGLAGLATLAPPISAQAMSAQAHPRAVIDAAKAGLDRVGDQIAQRDVVGVADFRLPSRQPRLHLVDLVSGAVESFLVAHGRGSDPAHTGWLQRFSNDMDADCTSEGAYLTGDYYDCVHGRAMILKGLDSTNNNVEARRVVVHQAWYVSPEIARTYGMLGRSQGCFAVSDADLPTVLDRLGPGRLLIATKL